MGRLLIVALFGAWASAAVAADAFTVSVWAGFPKEMKHRKDEYMLIYKGHRTLEHPEVQYALSIRYGYPEFKFMDAKGDWAGIMMHGGDFLCGKGRRIMAKELPHVKDNRPWHHLAGVFDHGTATLYLDGKVVMRTKGNPTPPENAHPEKRGVGESPSGFATWQFSGEVRGRYEPRAFKDEEIAAQYAKGLAELANVKPAYRVPNYPKVPVKGELPRTKAYFNRLAANPPPSRGPNCVAKVRRVGGIPRVEVDGRVVNGMAMIPSPYVDDDAATFSCRDFAAIGVKLFSNIWWGLSPDNKWWLGEGKYDFDYFDKRMMALVRASPEGWVFPRLKMDPPVWWANAHREEIYCHQVKTDSVKWRDLRRRMLRDVITHVENAPYAAHVIGYHLAALCGGEFLVFPVPFCDVPKDRAKRLAYLDTRSKNCADALLDAAQLVKELTGGNKLVGAFFGYYATEHRDFARVVKSPYLDFFTSPDTYEMRRGGQSGRSQVACQASCRLHNKIFWIEADERTLYAQTGEGYRCETMQESLDVAKRTLGYMLTEGWEAWWFLLEGNDTFHDETILSTLERGVRLTDEALVTAPPRTEADVAVFRRIQELDYGPNAPNQRLTDVYGVNLHVNTLPASGVVFDTYVFEDVLSPNLPDYKVYVFPDAKTISPVERAAIDRLVRRKGKTALWFCADADGETVSPEGWRRVDRRRPPKIGEMRRLFAEAGAHIWLREGEDILAAGRGYVMLHAATDGMKTLHLPHAADVAELYGLSPERKGVRAVVETLKRGETRIYNLKGIEAGK